MGEDVDPAKSFARARIGRAGVPRLDIRLLREKYLRLAVNYPLIGPMKLVTNGRIEMMAATPTGTELSITIDGRNLGEIYDAIRDERATWIAELSEADSRAHPDSAVVIDSILPREAERPQNAG